MRLLRRRLALSAVDRAEVLQVAVLLHLGPRLLAELAVPDAHVVVEVLHDIGAGEEIVRRRIGLQEHRAVGLHLKSAGAVLLVDLFLGLGAGIDLHREAATAALFDHLLELVGGIDQDVAGLKGAADTDRLFC